MTIKVILPDLSFLDPERVRKAITNGLTAAAKDVLTDFKTTTLTWQHKPEFEIVGSGVDDRTVGTDDEIYGYVNDGTPAHVIRAKNAKVLKFTEFYRAKTQPKVIGSNNGGPGGADIFRREVHHPGTTAREFDTEIESKWNGMLETIMQRAIDSEFD